MASENVLPWILEHRSLIRSPILEVGSRHYKEHSSLHLRKNVCGAEDLYIGCDLEAGDNVEIVVDMTRDSKTVSGAFGGRKFSTVFCVSVLEHIPDIFSAARNITDLLEEGGVLFLSVPFIFRFHGYPGDYWRFTPEAVRYLFPRIEFDRLPGYSMLSSLEEYDMQNLPTEFKKRNQFFFRPKSTLGRRVRKFLKGFQGGRFVPPYSLAPTMVNMIGFKKTS